MHRFVLFSLFLCAALHGSFSMTQAQPTDATSTPSKFGYPETSRGDQLDVYKNQAGESVEVADPYRWLEEDVRESDRVAAWVAQQQAFTEAYLEQLPERESFRQRLEELWNYERRSAPARFGKPGESPTRYTYRRNDGLQNQAVLFLTESPTQEGRVLIDPNEWSGDGTSALASYSSSPNGKLLAYLRSESGSDWRTIHLLDMDTGKELEEVVRWVRFGGVQWDNENAGFYYSRYPEPEEGEKYQASAKNQMICYHKLGTEQIDDLIIYQDPEHADRTASVSVTEEGNYLLLQIGQGTDPQNQLYFRKVDEPVDPKAKGLAAWKPLVADFDNTFSPTAVVGDQLYLYTDFKAPQYRIVRFDLGSQLDQSFREQLIEVIPEREATLEGASLLDEKFYASYLEDVAAAVLIYSADGAELGRVELPGVGSVGGFGGWRNAKETFYTYTSYDAPPTTYRYDLTNGQSTMLFQPDVGVDLSELVVKREFYSSKDGTKIPIFLMHRQGIKLDGNNPTLLYAYGGFTVSLTPGYSASRLAWVERGGVVAIANLRGGGEYGEAWHEAGKLDKKQNVFDDFIAAAEWLDEQGIADSAHLGIQGGSNGGLLVGAVMTQRPELFSACLPAVGVMDMLRFHRFTAGQFWRDEYGSADDPEMFSYLLGYSPYHNVRPNVDYPPTLVTTADTDDRVVPMHSFKFAAALQQAQTESKVGENPLLIRIETSAGHGAGKPISKRIEEAADIWAFLWQHVGEGELRDR